jgi:hypothetical protein
MPDLNSVLASIPGYGAYIAKRQMNEQQPLQGMQQAGMLVGLQEKLREQARRQAFEKDIAAIGPEATQEQLAQIAIKHGTPADVLKTQQSSLDRKSALEVARENKAAALVQAKATAEQMHEARMARITGDAEKRVETARHNAEMERLRLEIAKIGMAGGKPPPGYRHTPDGNLEAIPGGPADTKLQGQFNQDTAALSSMTNDMDRLAAEANRLKTHPGLTKATGGMAAVPLIGGTATWPGTDAANFKAGLETLKSQVAFGVLQNMRNNSKTGGALGQVSDKEGALLAANLAALDRAQSASEFSAALDRIVKFTEGAKGRLQAAYNMKHASKPQAAPGVAPAAPSVESLLEKYK